MGSRKEERQSRGGDERVCTSEVRWVGWQVAGNKVQVGWGADTMGVVGSRRVVGGGGQVARARSFKPLDPQCLP